MSFVYVSLACYPALARYIEAARRVGKLETVEPMLERCEKFSPRCVGDPKFLYCQGLQEWYTGRANCAIRSFHQVRNDDDFGLMASYHMIEICINPDGEVLGSETFENMDLSLLPPETLNAKENAIQMAQKILTVRSEKRVVQSIVILAQFFKQFM